MELAKIPTIEFPGIKDFDIKYKNEKIISLRSLGLKCDSQYYSQGIPGSYKDCYARETVAGIIIDKM